MKFRSNNARIGAGATAKESPITPEKLAVQRCSLARKANVYFASGYRAANGSLDPPADRASDCPPTNIVFGSPADRAANVLAALMKNHGGNQKKEVDFVRSLNIYIKL